MEAVTAATKSRPPFRPAGRYNLDALPPLGDYQRFLEKHKRFYERARKVHRPAVASRAEAAARHRGCAELEDALNNWSAAWRGPQWVSSTEIKPATRDYIVDRKVAVAIRRRHVATKNTRCLHDGASANLEGSEAIARSTLWRKTSKKTSELQEIVSGDTRTRAKKRRSEIGTANDRGAKDEAPKPKMRRVELKFQAVGPADAFKVSATLQSHATGNWKNKNSGVRKAMARGEMHRATSVKNAWLLDVIKALFKRRSSVIANLPPRMAFVDRHRSCFQPTTHSDWPQRRPTLSRNRRNKKSKAQKIALGGPTLEKRCVSEIDFDSSVVASARSSSALQISGTKDVTRLGGVIRFVKTVVRFVIFLVPRAWRILIGAFR